MAKNKKKRVSARAKIPTTKPVPSGMQSFVVHLLNPPSEHTVLATDEEDAAERICTRWEINVEVVKVVRASDGVVFEVRGKRVDGDWYSESSEIHLPDLPPRDAMPPPAPDVGAKHGSEPPPPPKPIPDFQCSFCGKRQREVKKLIAGPSIYICDECIVLCNEICLEDGIDVAKIAKQELTEDEKRAEREAAAAKSKAARIAMARTVLAELEEKGATKHLNDLKKLLGDETFTASEMKEFLQIADDAQKAGLSVAAYIEKQKKRIELHERLSKSSVWDGMLGYGVLASMLGMGAMYALGSKLGASKTK